MSSLSEKEFQSLSQYVHETCGIVVEKKKAYLFEQRLTPLMKELECDSYLDLYQKLKHCEISNIREKVIDAMTTNETSFFRDTHPFEVFRNDVLSWLGAKIKERKSRSYVRRGEKAVIWSAAASAGQEAFSLGMCIDEFCTSHPDVSLSDFLIKATDISREILAKAMTGSYSDLEVNRGLSPMQVARYFEKKDESHIVSKSLLNLVDFRHMNLTQDFSSFGGVDVVFCRNVLIYFDDKTRMKILSGIYHLMSPGGYLFLGAMESMFGLELPFVAEHIGKTTVYRKPSSSA